EPTAVVEAPIALTGSAVTDEVMPVPERGEQLLGLVSERVLRTITCAVHPPDLSGRARAGQHVKHREHRSRADSGTDQHDRTVTRAQHERAARRADVDDVADAEQVVDVFARDAVRFSFDADAVAARAR